MEIKMEEAYLTSENFVFEAKVKKVTWMYNFSVLKQKFLWQTKWQVSLTSTQNPHWNKFLMRAVWMQSMYLRNSACSFFVQKKLVRDCMHIPHEGCCAKVAQWIIMYENRYWIWIAYEKKVQEY